MTADVCLILEGTYPFVRGGVAAWTHELIQQQAHLRFHIVSILPRDERPEQKYELPKNVTGLTVIHLQDFPKGSPLASTTAERMFDAIRSPLERITTTRKANLNDFRALVQALSGHGKLGEDALINSEPAFNLISDMYLDGFEESSMLDYFWSWRALVGGLYSLINVPLPDARVYHAMSTGYAGMLLARAKVEKNRPCIITEHGIYTNERRIEIALADWLTETASKTLSIDRTKSNLRDFWIDTFTNYSRIAYEAADRIVTLFAGNAEAQLVDGAEPAKMRIIPNGVDIQRFGSIQRKAHERPTVALIGRVVPIKDIKSFLRALVSVREQLPDVRGYIVGPMDEDPAYVQECQALVEYFDLGQHVTFTGQVRIDEYLPEIDAIVISSISEAQPLVILEAGACGIPTVATDVGACREIIEGRSNEDPHLGHGGIVVPLGSPQSLATGLIRLLTDRDLYTRSSRTIAERIAVYYNKNDQVAAYKALYDSQF